MSPRPVHRSVREVTRVWARRQTGVLVYSHPEEAGQVTLLASVARGAFVCDQGPRILSALTAGGEVELVSVEVDGVGDWEATGEAIYRAVRDGVGELEEVEGDRLALSWAAHGAAAWSLPVRRQLEVLAPAIGEPRPLDGVLPAEDPCRTEVLAVAESLRRMGLVIAYEVAPASHALRVSEAALAAGDLEALVPAASTCEDQICPYAEGCELSGEKGEIGGAEVVLLAQERLLTEGRLAIARGDWDHADQVLAQARDLRLDHASVLALLALARAQRDENGDGEQAKEARQILSLARSLSPENQDVMRVTERLFLDPLL